MGVTQNYQEAFKWYEKAAKQNNAEAQLLLGTMCYWGEGVEKNFQKAKELFRKVNKNNNQIQEYYQLFKIQYPQEAFELQKLFKEMGIEVE